MIFLSILSIGGKRVIILEYVFLKKTNSVNIRKKSEHYQEIVYLNEKMIYKLFFWLPISTILFFVRPRLKAYILSMHHLIY